jgi:hypothetical protein
MASVGNPGAEGTCWVEEAAWETWHLHTILPTRKTYGHVRKDTAEGRSCLESGSRVTCAGRMLQAPARC